MVAVKGPGVLYLRPFGNVFDGFSEQTSVYFRPALLKFNASVRTPPANFPNFRHRMLSNLGCHQRVLATGPAPPRQGDSFHKTMRDVGNVLSGFET